MAGYLITDIDNTLYDYFSLSRGFRAMIHVLHRETAIDELILTQDYAAVFEKHGTIEYPFPTQELNTLSTYSHEEVVRLTKLTQVAFGRSYGKRLKLYEGVKETLENLRSSNWLICGVTNAPVSKAYARLRRLGILNYFHVLSGPEIVVPIPNNHVTQSDVDALRIRMKNVRKGLDKAGIISFTHPSDQLKPLATMFKSVLDYIEKREEHSKLETKICAVGDNVVNDLIPIRNMADILVWAKYGRDIESTNMETMVQLTNWQNKERLKAKNIDSDAICDFSIDSFQELQNILKLRIQLSLL